MQIHRSIQHLPGWHKAVVTIGSFDGVHNGHRNIIGQLISTARQIGGQSVLVTFEPHPRLVLPGGGPDFKLLNTLDEKIALLRTTGLDHLVVVPFDLAFSQMSGDEYLNQFLWEQFKPHTVIIGYDHRFGHDRSGNIETLKAWASTKGIEVMEISAQQIDQVTVSSTKIRNAILAGDLKSANHLLGSRYQLSGKVVLGDQIGRTIGYPTANLDLGSPHKLLPPNGIYACMAHTQAGRYKGMLYIGQRPTLSGQTEDRIEVHLLAFDGDLYGQEIRLDLVQYIRGDEKLADLAALKARIGQDKKEILAALQAQNTQATEDVAIVILNYNTARHLEKYLPSVIAHSPGARIIVADNGSPDHSVEWMRQHYPEIECLDLKENFGFAEGYNQALRKVKAEIYVILNSDVEVAEGWLDAPLAMLANDPTVAVVQPKILAERLKTHFEYAGAAGGWIDALGYPFCRGRIFSHTEADQGQYDTDQECFWAAGAAFFIRAELYHTFEGFDPDYFAHNEEIDLCWRLKRAGYKVVCTPASVVYHLGGGTLEYESPRKVFLNFRNSLFTLLKNLPVGSLLWVIPARLLLDGLAAVRFLLKGQSRSILAILKGHISFYQMFGHTWRKRQISNGIIAANMIQNKPNMRGMTSGSIVFQFYAFGKRTFNKIVRH